eukprot:9165168-Pyramimonas_sp.AAC.1
MLALGRPGEIFQHMETTLVHVRQQFFSHQVPNDPLYRQTASERAKLLRERARLRRSRVGMEEEGEELALGEQLLAQPTQNLRRRRQHVARTRQQGLLKDIGEAWEQRRMAEATRLSRVATTRRHGPTPRDGTLLRRATSHQKLVLIICPSGAADVEC